MEYLKVSWGIKQPLTDDEEVDCTSSASQAFHVQRALAVCNGNTDLRRMHHGHAWITWTKEFHHPTITSEHTFPNISCLLSI